MTELTTFIANADMIKPLMPTPCTYQALVLLRRDLGDDQELFEGDVTGTMLASQIAREMQVAYNEGMAGHFQVLKVGTNLVPQILNVTTPETPLSPWQREFAAAYGETDLDWMETLADTHEAGDTIFTAIMVELDEKEDCTNAEVAVQRLDSLIESLMKARDAINL